MNRLLLVLLGVACLVAAVNAAAKAKAAAVPPSLNGCTYRVSTMEREFEAEHDSRKNELKIISVVRTLISRSSGIKASARQLKAAKLLLSQLAPTKNVQGSAEIQDTVKSGGRRRVKQLLTALSREIHHDERNAIKALRQAHRSCARTCHTREKMLRILLTRARQTRRHWAKRRAVLRRRLHTHIGAVRGKARMLAIRRGHRSPLMDLSDNEHMSESRAIMEEAMSLRSDTAEDLQSHLESMLKAEKVTSLHRKIARERKELKEANHSYRKAKFVANSARIRLSKTYTHCGHLMPLPTLSHSKHSGSKYVTHVKGRVMQSRMTRKAQRRCLNRCATRAAIMTKYNLQFARRKSLACTQSHQHKDCSVKRFLVKYKSVDCHRMCADSMTMRKLTSQRRAFLHKRMKDAEKARSYTRVSLHPAKAISHPQE